MGELSYSNNKIIKERWLKNFKDELTNIKVIRMDKMFSIKEKVLIIEWFLAQVYMS